MSEPLSFRVGRAEDAEAAGEMVARSRSEIYRVRRDALGDEVMKLAFPEVFAEKRRSTAELVSRLLAAGWHTARIDALKLPAGVYWLRLATQESIETRKVQVQH